MRVLLVHQLYQMRGGAMRVLFGIEKSLLDHGDSVAVLTSRTSTDEPGDPRSVHFRVDGFDSTVFDGAALSNRLKWAAYGIYSFPARRAVREAVREFRPDVAIVLKPEYQLTPSVLQELSSCRLPVVQWLVDYRPWCTQGQFYNIKEKTVCTRCAGGLHFHGARFVCDRRLSWSVYGAIARTLTTSLMRVPWTPTIYVVPTEANREFVSATVGIEKTRIRVLPHPLNVSAIRTGRGFGEGPILFYGGIVPPKGVWTLVGALRHLPGEKLFVAGVTVETQLAGFRRQVVEYGLTDRIEIDTQIRWGGRLRELIRSSRLVVNPSEWVDALDYTTLESMALGKPVLVGDSGGNANFVTAGEDGFVFKSGDEQALADAMRSALISPEKLDEMGRAARATVTRRLDGEVFYSGLREVIEEACGRHTPNRSK
ncbi:MAG: glycosyltransferase family 4 protein [Proteobacteria bacterium]|jgi:glycosyltransferase involved in cell wall biosynthesis|nr:glycosyltransferase family 4 protein [Pseudomonadota bacterium]